MIFGLADKALATIGGGVSLALAGALAFTTISKNSTINELRRSNITLTDERDGYLSDLTQCRTNRITLEDAARRQNEAVAEARSDSAERIARLERTSQRARGEANRARNDAERILAKEGTGSPCADADRLILEELAQ